MKKSRTKGCVGEREWCQFLNSVFKVSYARTPLSGGMDLRGDVMRKYGSKPSIVDTFHWEVKRVEKINIHKCYEQAFRDKRGGKIPVVAFRRNKDTWKVCLDANDFFALLQRIDTMTQEIEALNKLFWGGSER